MITIEELTMLDKLNQAFYDCAKVSFWKQSIQRYQANLLVENIQLQQELRDGVYKVKPTYNFLLNERGKLRYIKAPSIRDRIVQKVVCNEILIPQLKKYLIYDNYASLKNRGTSFARKRIDIFLKEYIKAYGVDGYVLQIDIKKYFDSIDHNVLKHMLHRKISESKEVMDLIDYIVDTSSDNGVGLNLGSEAPQMFAIFYLSPVDNYVKSVSGIKYYGRYMDDMIVIHKDKQVLKNLLVGIKQVLSDLKLEIHDSKTHITRLSQGFTYLQIKYSVSCGKIIKRPTRSKIVRERRRLKRFKHQYDVGKMSEEQIYNCYKSWRNGLLKDCNCCKTSIAFMDELYDSLFVHNKTHKQNRDALIEECMKGGNE